MNLWLLRVWARISGQRIVWARHGGSLYYQIARKTPFGMALRAWGDWYVFQAPDGTKKDVAVEWIWDKP